RQDRSGLYEADVATSVPPTCATALAPTALGEPAPGSPLSRAKYRELLQRNGVRKEKLDPYAEALVRVVDRARRIDAALESRGRPGGALEGEITRLRYPLHPGARWTIRESPLFTAVVEDQEILDLPAGRLP